MKKPSKKPALLPVILKQLLLLKNKQSNNKSIDISLARTLSL
jgi:hypothetical protein